MRVRLWIFAGGRGPATPVIETEIPDFSIIPEVLIWRGRAFMIADAAEPAPDRPRDYKEVFTYKVKL